MTAQPIASIATPGRAAQHRMARPEQPETLSFEGLLDVLTGEAVPGGTGSASGMPAVAGQDSQGLAFLALGLPDPLGPTASLEAPPPRLIDDNRPAPSPEPAHLPEMEEPPTLTPDATEVGRPGGLPGRTVEDDVQTPTPKNAPPLPATRAAAEPMKTPPLLPPVVEGGPKVTVIGAAVSGRPIPQQTAAAMGATARDGQEQAARGDGDLTPERSKGRPTVTAAQNFSIGTSELVPKRMPADTAAAPGRLDQGALRLSAGGPVATLPTLEGGPVTDLEISASTSTRFEVRVGVETAELAGRIAAERGRLRDDLAAVGAELDALHVEVSGSSRAQEPGAGRVSAEAGRNDAGAAALSATPDPGGREMRREQDGGLAERLARERDAGESESKGNEGRRPDAHPERQSASDAEARRDGWNDDEKTGRISGVSGQRSAADPVPQPTAGIARTRVDRLA